MTSTGNRDTIQTSAETGVVSEGLRIQLLANIQDSKKLILSFALDKQDSVKITDFAFGEGSLSRVQLPEFAYKDGIFRAQMRTNETLVLTGVSQDATTADTKGLGHHLNTLFGGSQSASNKKTVSVILITPVIKSRV